jgi:uncharacterized protein (DUF169 family)
MDSKIAKFLKSQFYPVATIFANSKPEKSIQFKRGRYGCVMNLFASAASGKTAVFDRETYGCWGGGVGLGFGNTYKEFPGGEGCFCYFLSVGNKNNNKGESLLAGLKDKISESLYEKFYNGEGLMDNPELVGKFLENDLPIIDISFKYVIFKPLSECDHKDNIKVVTFLVSADQLSAFVILCNHFREGINNVGIPQAAACHQIGILTYNECEKENPKAIVGLTDISARLNILNTIGGDFLTISMPYKLYIKLEEISDNSFLTRPTWNKIVSKYGN